MKNNITILSLLLILAACGKFIPQKRIIQKTVVPRIVMLGDSETRRINHYWGTTTNWNTLAGYDSIFNYGYDAYNSGDILSGPVYDAMDKHPDVIFLMIGINDAHQSLPLSFTLANIRTLIDTVRNRGIDIVMESVLPTTNYYDTLYGGFPTNGILAERARVINDSIKKICFQKNVPLLDIRLNLLASNGITRTLFYLRNDKSIDGIHLNYSGYEVWKTHLVNYINSHY